MILKNEKELSLRTHTSKSQLAQTTNTLPNFDFPSNNFTIQRLKINQKENI